MIAEVIGWVSSGILLLTLARQVVTQWRSEATAGVSRWLFIGQLAASTGFALYSWLLGNWVFLITNVALLLTALTGEAIYLRNRRRAAEAAQQQRAGIRAPRDQRLNAFFTANFRFGSKAEVRKRPEVHTRQQ